MRRIHPAKARAVQEKRKNKILNRIEKQKRSCLRQETQRLNRIDRQMLASRMEMLVRRSQWEKEERLKKQLGLGRFPSLDETIALAVAANAKTKREEERFYETAKEIKKALESGMTVTVSSNGDFTVSEPVKIPNGTVVIYSPRVSFDDTNPTSQDA